MGTSFPTPSRDKNNDINNHSLADQFHQHGMKRTVASSVDLLRFQQLRKEADIRIDDLRYEIY
jgi:hypothetical protein